MNRRAAYYPAILDTEGTFKYKLLNRGDGWVKTRLISRSQMSLLPLSRGGRLGVKL